MSSLELALRDLLAGALPGLFGGDPPAVRISAASDLLTIDRDSLEATAGAPAVDDRRDRLPFDPERPEGPYTLSQPPYPGARRVRLLSPAGDRTSLRDDEVRWDPADPRRFRLFPRPARDLAATSAVEVLYGVTAVFTRLKALRALALDLEADDARLAEAEALALAAIALNREPLIAAARAIYAQADYGAEAEVKALRLLRAERVAAGRLRLGLEAELELTLRRALADDEGRPIRRIVGPGRPDDTQRPVDPRVDVDA